MSDRLQREAAPTLYILSVFLLIVAANMLLPIVCSLLYGEDDFFALVVSAVVIVAVALPVWRWTRGRTELLPRHAFFLASIGWVVVAAAGTLPFLIHGSIPSFTDAFFEMISGFTTTGATNLRDIEALPHGLLLWRSQTHLIGGMGFVTIAVMLLPHGLAGLRLFRADSSPGQVITRERFTARNRDAMWVLWGIYLVLNVALIALLWISGMSLFDALCHAFSTVATAGFSSYQDSIGHFGHGAIQWLLMLFMFLGGMTFVLFFHLYHRDFRSIARNTEFRWYVGALAAFSAFAAASLWHGGVYDFGDAVREGTFHVVSLLTTTGFSAVDYEQWPPAAQMVLMIVSCIGACAGSTTSGIKIVHYVIILKFITAFIRRTFVQPLAVVSVRLNGERIDDEIVHLAMCYFIVNALLVALGALVLSTSDGLMPSDAVSSVIATLMNNGVGFGVVGPTQTFADFSPFAKWYLSANMVIGRLELFSVLVLLYPSFWRR